MHHDSQNLIAQSISKEKREDEERKEIKSQIGCIHNIKAKED